MLASGDRAIVLETGDTIDPRRVDAVGRLERLIETLRHEGRLEGITETVPTFRSLAIVFDPRVTDQGTLLKTLRDVGERETDPHDTTPARRWTLPVCHDATHAPDLEAVARETGLSPDEVIARHEHTEFRVYMLGFLPGFAFMGDLPRALHLPRRDTPRTRVPRGSVAIARQLTAVYPWHSPGGWHLIGHCPMPLFDAERDPPALLRAGDTVIFRSIDTDALAAFERDRETGRLDITRWCRR